MDENYHNQANTAPTAAEQTAKPFTPPSEFRGRTIQLIGWRLLGLLLTGITLGIGAPWAHCMVLRWQIKHTYINGKQLYFDGKGLQLLGRYLVWGLLTLVTFGIYALFIPVRMRRWKAEHTRFATPSDAQAKAKPSGLLIFACIMAGIAAVAVIALAAVLLADKAVDSNTGYNDSGDMSIPTGNSIYQFIIDENGNYIIVSPNGGDSLIVVPGGDGGMVKNPDGEEDNSTSTTEATSSTTEATSSTTEAKPTTVTGPIVGNWIMIGKHVSGSWESSEYYFKSDGTFYRTSNLYDYHEHNQSWSHFIGHSNFYGWYTYDGGVLTMHYTHDNVGPTSEGGSLNVYEKENIVTCQVSFSSDNQALRFRFKDNSTGKYKDYTDYYYRIVDSTTDTLARYYP